MQEVKEGRLVVLLVFGLELLETLVLTYGYVGALLVGFLSSFTLFIPSPAFFVIFILGSKLNPLVLGISAGIGSAIGEMISYFAGYGVNFIVKKYRKNLDEIKKSFYKYKPSVIIFFFAATPLPFDLVGILCGAIRYDKKKFFVATLAGKLVKFTFIAYAGFYSIEWIVNYFQID